MEATIETLKRALCRTSSVCDLGLRALMDHAINSYALEIQRGYIQCPNFTAQQCFVMSQKLKHAVQTNGELRRVNHRLMVNAGNTRPWDIIPDDLHRMDSASLMASAMVWMGVCSYLPGEITSDHYAQATDYEAGSVVMRMYPRMVRDGARDQPVKRNGEPERVPEPAEGATKPEVLASAIHQHPLMDMWVTRTPTDLDEEERNREKEQKKYKYKGTADDPWDCDDDSEPEDRFA